MELEKFSVIYDMVLTTLFFLAFVFAIFYFFDSLNNGKFNGIIQNNNNIYPNFSNYVNNTIHNNYQFEPSINNQFDNKFENNYTIIVEANST